MYKVCISMDLLLRAFVKDSRSLCRAMHNTKEVKECERGLVLRGLSRFKSIPFFFFLCKLTLHENTICNPMKLFSWKQHGFFKVSFFMF